MEETESQATVEAMVEALIEDNQMATEDPMEIVMEERHQEAQVQLQEDQTMVEVNTHFSSKLTLLGMMCFLTKIMLTLQVVFIHFQMERFKP